MAYQYIGSNTEDLKSGDYISPDNVDFNSGNFVENSPSTEGRVMNGTGQVSTNSFGEPYDSIWDQGYLPENDYHNDSIWRD